MTNAVYISLLLMVGLFGLYFAWSSLLGSLAMRNPRLILIGGILTLANLITASYWITRLAS